MDINHAIPIAHDLQPDLAHDALEAPWSLDRPKHLHNTTNVEAEEWHVQHELPTFSLSLLMGLLLQVLS